MLLDEIFGEVSLKDIQRYIAKKALRESPIDMVQQTMKFWVKAHLTQLRDRNVKEVSLESIVKELNDVSNEMGFAEIDPDEPDMAIDLIMGADDKEKPEFVEKIENGIVYLQQKQGKQSERVLDDQNKAAAESNVDNMAKNAVNKDLKGGDKL
jgi:hypothetical protein